MRFMFTMLLWSGLITPGFASDHMQEDSRPVEQGAVSIRPCDWWRFESDPNGYVCTRYPRRIDVLTPSGLEATKTIKTLLARIEQLEQRLSALEGN